MKLIGPGILLLVVLLSCAIMFAPKFEWPLGSILILAVFVGIIVTMVAEIKDSKKAESPGE